MKKTLVATTALGLLALSATSMTALADSQESQLTGVTNKTDVTFTPGSGEDVDPIVPDRKSVV